MTIAQMVAAGGWILLVGMLIGRQLTWIEIALVKKRNSELANELSKFLGCDISIEEAVAIEKRIDRGRKLPQRGGA